MSAQGKSDSGGEDQYVPYSQRAEWSDVTPVLQDDGPGGVVDIDYSKEFVDAMNYFRGVMAVNEKSERALQLTEDVIGHNAANYTAWYYRRLCLHQVSKDAGNLDAWANEFGFIESILCYSPKNYQIWFHRQQVVEVTQDASRELAAIEEVLAGDAKNYHAWTHRQWVLRTFKLWKDELEFVKRLLDQDVRNNSAWNHRWFVIRHTAGADALATDDALLQREVDFTFEAIKKVPRNESAWAYLKGLLATRPADSPAVTSVQDRVKALRGSGEGDADSNVPLLAFLAHLATKRSEVEDAQAICEELALHADPLRGAFWRQYSARAEETAAR